jgi:hypothetical protein
MPVYDVTISGLAWVNLVYRVEADSADVAEAVVLDGRLRPPRHSTDAGFPEVPIPMEIEEVKEVGDAGL